jgi:hypothetical protein
MGLPKIIRKLGPFKRKHGIFLDNLKPYQQKILFDNPLIKDSADDDQFMLILFRLADMDISKKTDRKIYYNPYKDIVTDYKQIETDSKYIDWNCAICKADIKSVISEFNIDNFICKDCHDAYGSHNKIKTVDSRIVDCSIKFRKHCKNILFKEQRTFMRYIAKFKKG